MAPELPPEDELPKVTRYLEKRAKLAKQLGYGVLIPTMMLVGPTLGYFAGWWLEGRFGHAPWFSVGGLILGFATVIRQMVNMLR